MARGQLCRQQEFLSTLSLRRATWVIAMRVNVLSYFYPRSPCGERHKRKHRNAQYKAISIHALLAESDAVCCHR